MQQELLTPEFSPEEWRKNIATGCYTYAMQWNVSTFVLIGDIIDERVTECEEDEEIIDVLTRELEFLGYEIKECDVTLEAPKGTFKIFLMRYELTGHYHFLREDSNKQWSHKYPKELPTNKDYHGNIINNPLNLCDASYYGWCFLVSNK